MFDFFKIFKNNNNQKVYLKLKNTDKQAIIGLRRGLYDCGKELTLEARRLINLKPKHGHIYRIGVGLKGKKLKRLRDHRASAPGEAPAIITGKLRKSINFLVSGSKQLEFGVDKKFNADYGKYLDYKDLIAMSGQRTKNIKPRPYLSASYQKNKVIIAQRLGLKIKEELNK